MLNLKNMQSWSATGWSQIQISASRKPAKESGEQGLLWGNQWIFGCLSDLKQPWLDVTGETRACSTCNWRSMHECSVGWLSNVLATSRSLFLNELWRGWKSTNRNLCSNYDVWSSESWVFGLEQLIVKGPCPSARHELACSWIHRVHPFCESGGWHVTPGKIGILVPANPIDVDQQVQRVTVLSQWWG